MGEELNTIWRQLTTDAQRGAYLRKWENIVNVVGQQLYGTAWNSSYSCAMDGVPAINCGDRVTANANCPAAAAFYFIPTYVGYVNGDALDMVDNFALQNLNETANEIETIYGDIDLYTPGEEKLPESFLSLGG